MIVAWLGRRCGGKTVASPVGMNEAEIIHSRGMTVSRAVTISKALMMMLAAVRFMGERYPKSLGGPLYLQLQEGGGRDEDEKHKRHRRGVTHVPPLESLLVHQHHDGE